VAGSILRNAGMHELVTDNAADYERKVLELATNPGKLQEIRHKVQEARDTSPLFDTPRFVRNLEGAFETMLEAYVNGASAPDESHVQSGGLAGRVPE
jgi:predicted O-linked N-acetylglucosamine transferase (SPINDLY family)